MKHLKDVYEMAKKSIGVEIGPAFRWECQWASGRLKEIEKDRKDFQEGICDMLSSEPGYRLVQTIPGVGKVLGAIFVVEIGDCAKYRHWRQVIKLAGLDLAVVESGQFSGRPRISRQGKALLRWAAYQAAVIASAKNPQFKELYLKALGNRTGESGARKRALIKIAAKLMKIVFAVMRDQRPYTPEKASAA